MGLDGSRVVPVEGKRQAQRIHHWCPSLWRGDRDLKPGIGKRLVRTREFFRPETGWVGSAILHRPHGRSGKHHQNCPHLLLPPCYFATTEVRSAGLTSNDASSRSTSRPFNPP